MVSLNNHPLASPFTQPNSTDSSSESFSLYREGGLQNSSKHRVTELTRWISLIAKLLAPYCTFGKPFQNSSALDITESRLGRGLKSPRLLSWWDDGRMRAVRALFTKSPSTVPILTNEFVIADLNICNWCLERLYEDDWLLRLFVFLCKLQRNEPGWVVGEHMQVFFWFDGNATLFRRCCRGETTTERLRDVEKRTEGVGDMDLCKLTRVGDEDRVIKLLSSGAVEKVEKVDEEEEQKRPNGETERWALWLNPEPFDLPFDDVRTILTENSARKKNKKREGMITFRRQKDCLERRLALYFGKPKQDWSKAYIAEEGDGSSVIKRGFRGLLSKLEVDRPLDGDKAVGGVFSGLQNRKLWAVESKLGNNARWQHNTPDARLK